MRLASLCAVGAVLIATPAAAQDLKGVWFVGGMVSSDSSGYAGMVRALPGARLGKGLAVRGSIGAGEYEYESDLGPTEARWEGLDVALVHQTSGAWGWSNLSLGAGVKHTKLDPLDPNNESEGTRGDVSAQADGGALSKDWRFNWLGAYAFEGEEYGLKLQLTRAIGASGYRAGLEAGLQGDPNYQRTTAGVQVGRAFGQDRRYEMTVSVGASRFRDSDTTGYGAVSLSHTF